MHKRFIIQLVALLALILAGLYLTFKDYDLVGQYLPNQKEAEVKRLTIGQNTLNVEVANTPTNRSKGLGGRDSLAQDSGMLFVFSQKNSYQFWMKGMRFPLDIIFISDNKIVDIIKNVPIPTPSTPDQKLPRYSSSTPFDQVLEVNAGFVDAHNNQIGDTISEM